MTSPPMKLPFLSTMNIKLSHTSPTFPPRRHSRSPGVTATHPASSRPPQAAGITPAGIPTPAITTHPPRHRGGNRGSYTAEGGETLATGLSREIRGIDPLGIPTSPLPALGPAGSWLPRHRCLRHSCAICARDERGRGVARPFLLRETVVIARVIRIAEVEDDCVNGARVAQ